MNTEIKFKRVKSELTHGYNYEARGDFRRDVTFIRITKKTFSNVWTIIIFRNNALKGELYINNCVSKKDAIITANQEFAI